MVINKQIINLIMYRGSYAVKEIDKPIEVIYLFLLISIPYPTIVTNDIIMLAMPAN